VLTNQQCDGVRPYCSQCTKSGRECSGYEADSGGLPFRSENAYAAGTARRPRDGRHTTKSRSVISASQSKSPKKSLSKSPMEQESQLNTLSTQVSTKSSSPNIPSEFLQFARSLSEPLENQAIIYFVRGWIEPDTLVDAVVDDVGSILHKSTQAPKSTLNLAITAVSLAVFGKTKKSEVALATSREKYTQALGSAKQSIANTSQATSDEMLLSVMMLASYEVSSSFQLDPEFRKSGRPESLSNLNIVLTSGPEHCLQHWRSRYPFLAQRSSPQWGHGHPQSPKNATSSDEPKHSPR